ncbi:hypothetical protein AMECASPLE_025206 [Ameca splendens]|uniref:Uncharacterized protein n=1 Tax=Ameca splendens TaxID=208324 RepID=A0ABV0YG08_9TELE
MLTGTGAPCTGANRQLPEQTRKLLQSCFSRRTRISQRFWPKQAAPSPPATTCQSSVKFVTHRTLLTTWIPSLSTHRSITTRITGLLFSLSLALSPMQMNPVV